MKRILLFFVFILLASACNNRSQTQKINPENVSSEKKDVVEVLYFHGKKRCITCNAIENLSKEVVTTDFSQELKEGKLVFKVIDISKSENEEIANKYEVTWSSLFINKWKDGVESINNMTEYGFSHAKNSPEIFKTGVKDKIRQVLK